MIIRKIYTVLVVFSIILLDTTYYNSGNHFEGVNPELQELFNKYEMLANKKHIYFKHRLTAGFDKLEENIAGECVLNSSFREIIIDTPFWKQSSFYKRVQLIYHELTHCWCGRDHDFAKDQYYKKNINENKKEGFFKDECPSSIMYPSIFSDKCMQDHYEHYINEMFDRCNPY